MEMHSKIPQLRFSEFDSQWENVRLGDIAIFSKGKGISKSDIEVDGSTECIRYGELYTYYHEIVEDVISRTNINKANLVFSEANDVIIPASGETQIDIATASCVLRSGIALSGDLNIIRTKNNGIFLSLYLNNKKKLEIANLAQGVSVVHLYSKQLATLQLNLPSLSEQQKIASFFTAIDLKISQLKQKLNLLEQYKKGVMQKIFSQEIRFKPDLSEVGGENGKEFPKWKGKKLRDIATFYSGGTPLTSNKGYYEGDIPFIKSGEISCNKTEQFISSIALKNSSAKLVKAGNILFALYGATSGEVAISKINGAINQAVLCIKSNENHYFLYSYLRFKKESIIKTYLQGGQGNLSAEIVKSIEIGLPILLEQTKIANFLSAIDDKINHTQKQIEKADIWKKGLMQQMFV